MQQDMVDTYLAGLQDFVMKSHSVPDLGDAVLLLSALLQMKMKRLHKVPEISVKVANDSPSNRRRVHVRIHTILRQTRFSLRALAP